MIELLLKHAFIRRSFSFFSLLIVYFLEPALDGKAIAATTSDLAAIQQARAEVLADPGSALNKAQQIEVRISSPRGGEADFDLLTVWWIEAAALTGLNRPAEASAVINRAFMSHVEKRFPNTSLLANLYQVRGIADNQSGDLEKALREFHFAYQTFSAAHDPRGMAITLQDIGVLYMIAYDFKRAGAYFSQAAAIYDDDPKVLLTGYANSAIVEQHSGRPHAAAVDLQRAYKIAQQIGSKLLQARLLTDSADVQLDIGRKDRAGYLLSQADHLIKISGGDWLAKFLQVRARLAYMDDNLSTALIEIEAALSALKSNATGDQEAKAQQTAYMIYKAAGRPADALQHLEKFKQLDDQARSVAASAGAALLAARFDFANQNLKIAQLRAGEIQRDTTIARDRARTRAMVLGLLLAATAVIATLLLIGYVSIRRSRDRERLANAELSHTNRELEKALAARTEFLATTSHEIRTPLNGILGMTQVLLADRTLAATHREQIQLVHGAGRTMRALVDDILDVAKMAKGEFTLHEEPVELHELLLETSQVWKAQAEAKGVSIVFDPGDSPPRILGDETRLRQILFNLMSNAVKFTDRGTVTLRAGVTATRDTGAERLRVTVNDTGLGIPQDKLADIFESFRQVDGGTTRRHGGTGLGLAICRSLCQAMGGTITVESVLGAGACFDVDLPLHRIAAAVPARRVAMASLAESRLLLLDGNPLSRSILQALLAPQVAAIQVVGEPSSAEEAVRAGTVDLLLADAAAFQADGAAAAALARNLADQNGRMAVLLAEADEAMRPVLDTAGAAMIRKPISAIDLVSALKALYKTSGPPAEIAA